jgi:hypothetical protein
MIHSIRQNLEPLIAQFEQEADMAKKFELEERINSIFKDSLSQVFDHQIPNVVDILNLQQLMNRWTVASEQFHKNLQEKIHKVISDTQV